MYSNTLFFAVSFAIVALVAALPSAKKIKTNTDDLVAVVQVFRHGERSPTSFVPNDPYAGIEYWPHGYGQLSNTGKKQHYSLGQFTRRRYGDFLPEKYNCSYFKAQTTDVDRTHMSCQSNLAAIFPPSDEDLWSETLPWQPIPVHPIDENVLVGTPDCTNYYAEWIKVISTSELFVKINEENAELYSTLSNVTGCTINTVLTGWTLYDALFIEQLNGLDIPDWAQQNWAELKSYASYAFLSLSYTDDQKKLIAGSFLNTVSTLFQSLFEDPTCSPKFQMYSAHDSNIATLLNTLGAFDPHPPAYASSLYFELRNKSNTPVINVWHKDDDLDVFEPITIEGCEFDCTIDQFNTVLAPWLINTTEWDTLCSSSTVDLSSISEDVDALWELYQQAVSHVRRKKGKGGVSHIVS